MSDAARYAEVRAAFDDLVDRAAAEREAALHELARRDPQLASEVRALLAADAEQRSFLEPPEARDVERVARAASGSGAPREEPEGEELEIDSRLGAYRIVRKIASGGMGAVYLASRADRQFEGFVAIKVQRSARSSDRAAARARLERQTLASLTHPYIARLLDGGETADGRPYLVMEYIEGEPIDRWCTERRAPIAARLDLLQRVGAAVAHAHRKLVVHRDIKPSNILVTPDGTPRLLDFGIARLLSGTDSDARQRTQVVFTPGYASPEQQRGERVGTTADIYSLGRLLQALLPSDLPRFQRTELEAIAARASASREDERYASVEQLLQELQRFRAELPVEAHPGTWSYRARKFARRNRLPLAIGAGGLAGLLAAGFALFAAWHSASAERVAATEARKRALEALTDAADAEQLAEARARDAARDAARYRAALQFLHRLFTAPTSRGQGPEITIAAFLDDARSELAALPAAQDEASAPIHRFLAHAYVGLGRFDHGIAEYERAVEKLRALHGEDHPETIAALVELGDALCVGDRSPIGRPILERQLEVLRAREQRFSGQDLLEVHLLRSLARMHLNLGELALGLERAEQALALCERASIAGVLRAEVTSTAAALELSRDPRSPRCAPWIEESIRAAEAELGPDHPITQDFRLNLAHHHWSRGEPKRALEIAEAVLAARRPRYPRSHPALIAPLVAVGRMKSEARQHEEALQLLREAVLIFQQTFGPATERRDLPRNELAMALRRAGQIEEAEKLLLELLADHERKAGRVSAEVLSTLVSLGVLDESRGRYREAHARFEQALEITRTLHGEKHVDTARAWMNLGTTQFRLGALEASSECFEKALALRRELLPPTHPSLADTLYSWSRTELARERFELASTLLREAADVLQRSESPVPARIARALLDLGFARSKLGDAPGERAALEEVRRLARARGAEGLEDLRVALERLVQWAEREGASEAAASYRAELEGLAPRKSGSGG